MLRMSTRFFNANSSIDSCTFEKGIALESAFLPLGSAEQLRKAPWQWKTLTMTLHHRSDNNRIAFFLNYFVCVTRGTR